MSILRRLTFLLFLGLCTLAIVPAAVGQAKIRDLKPTVILLGIDGFRHDYVDKYDPPHISRLARNGIRAKGLIPAFPTKTFPNFYSIVTGKYPANHGIVDNSFFDGEQTFRYTNLADAEASKWWIGEPIWITAEKQGKRTATYFYPGSSAAINDTKATLSRRYNGRVPNEMRIDELVRELGKPTDQRPAFLATYFSEVDEVAHEFGPDADEVRYAVLNVDRLVGRLVDALRTRGIADRVHLIIVSDHGLTTVKTENTVIVDELVDTNLYARNPITSRIIWQFFPKQGKVPEVLRALAAGKGMKCWEREKFPERFKYRGSDRIPPIMCVADLGWQLSTRESYDAERRSIDARVIRGDHGFDNIHRDMQGVFIGSGSSFKQNVVAEPFENIEIYNLMCKILGLTPAKNDGDINRVKHLLR